MSEETLASTTRALDEAQRVHVADKESQQVLVWSCTRAVVFFDDSCTTFGLESRQLMQLRGVGLPDARGALRRTVVAAPAARCEAQRTSFVLLSNRMLLR